jgi:outer membrane protein insertion porin family
VQINHIDNEELRAPEVLELNGHSTITSAAIQVKRNTTNVPILPYQGTVTTAGWEHVGAFGGDFDFDKFTLSFDYYTTVYADLLDRRTILALRADSGYISGSAPFFERFYLGGVGSVRGFRFRGISPRSGIDDDPIGGDFMASASAELNFPLAQDILRGVVFVDAGTVNRELALGTIRTSVGFGFRLTLPFFGQVPIALDFGFPITKDDQDEKRFFSFSLGLGQ